MHRGTKHENLQDENVRVLGGEAGVLDCGLGDGRGELDKRT